MTIAFNPRQAVLRARGQGRRGRIGACFGEQVWRGVIADDSSVRLHGRHKSFESQVAGTAAEIKYPFLRGRAAVSGGTTKMVSVTGSAISGTHAWLCSEQVQRRIREGSRVDEARVRVVPLSGPLVGRGHCRSKASGRNGGCSR